MRERARSVNHVLLLTTPVGNEGTDTYRHRRARPPVSTHSGETLCRTPDSIRKASIRGQVRIARLTMVSADVVATDQFRLPRTPHAKR